MGFALSDLDEQRLKGVHPDLVRVVRRAAELVPPELRFRVVEGVRTVERQRELVRKGASKTMNSRHIPAKNGLAHAVDLVVFDGKDVDWAWPVTNRLSKFVKLAARDCNVAIEWGGDWVSFKDGPHWQLPWKLYPGGVDTLPPPVKTEADVSKVHAQKAAAPVALASLGEAAKAGAAQLEPLSGYSDTIRTIFLFLAAAAALWAVYSIATAHRVREEEVVPEETE